MCRDGAIVDMVQLGENAEEMGECRDDAVWGRVQLADDDRMVQYKDVAVV